MPFRSHTPGQTIVHSHGPFVQYPDVDAKPKKPALCRVSSICSGNEALGRLQDRPMPNKPRSRDRIDSDMPSTLRSGSKSVFSARNPCTNFCAAGSISCSIIVLSNAIERVLSSDGHTLRERYVQWRAASLTLTCETQSTDLCKAVGIRTRWWGPPLRGSADG